MISARRMIEPSIELAAVKLSGSWMEISLTAGEAYPDLFPETVPEVGAQVCVTLPTFAYFPENMGPQWRELPIQGIFLNGFLANPQQDGLGRVTSYYQGLIQTMQRRDPVAGIYLAMGFTEPIEGQLSVSKENVWAVGIEHYPNVASILFARLVEQGFRFADKPIIWSHSLGARAAIQMDVAGIVPDDAVWIYSAPALQVDPTKRVLAAPLTPLLNPARSLFTMQVGEIAARYFGAAIGIGSAMQHPLYQEMAETHSSILIGYQAKQLLAAKIDRAWMKVQAANLGARDNEVMLLGSADSMVNNRVNRRFAHYASIPIIRHRKNHLLELLEPNHALDIMQDTIDALRL